MALETWKWPHIAKGMLTWVPPVNAWRRRHMSTGGTDNSRYCYSVWLRHLVTLQRYGLQIKGARVGELGPGDSIGTGLAALLSGAEYYIGLDVLPLSAATDIKSIFKELVRLYKERAPIPEEFPRLRPRLDSYEFPDQLIDWRGFNERSERIRAELSAGLDYNKMVRYRAPWTSIEEIEPNSLDLIFSQAVLEYAAPLDEVYRAMSLWLKRGGYASHVIDFSAHYLSPYWNGHWAYSTTEWRLAHGRRETFLNRRPLSVHVDCARQLGFEILAVNAYGDSTGLPDASLATEFRHMKLEDRQARGALLIFCKASE